MVENIAEFDIPDELLDEIQHNIEHIIDNFDVPEANKKEVIRQINYMYTRTKYLSLTDELTGLPNRRYFENEFNKEFSRAQRYGNKLTLIMFDIDYFKSVNDTYGHPCGDYVLQQISNAALQTFRKTDMVFRIGGEEFAVLLTETDINGAKIPLERFRKTVETLNLVYNDQKINVTVSIGACEHNKLMTGKEQLVSKTDMALYDAKKSGRNKIIFAN